MASDCVITLNNPSAPTDPATPDVLIYYFSGEDLNNLGSRVWNQVTFTISDPSTVSSTISEIAPLSAQTTTFMLDGTTTPYMGIQSFYDNIQDTDKQCGIEFTLSDSETDDSTFASGFNSVAF